MTEQGISPTLGDDQALAGRGQSCVDDRGTAPLDHARDILRARLGIVGTIEIPPAMTGLEPVRQRVEIIEHGIPQHDAGALDPDRFVRHGTLSLGDEDSPWVPSREPVDCPTAWYDS
ncbi:MAG: hypothetical protein H0T72_13605 [Chloroflexia bacterium]|nr:hypothetical protein [Chloroflexia bacterium]